MSTPSFFDAACSSLEYALAPLGVTPGMVSVRLAPPAAEGSPGNTVVEMRIGMEDRQAQGVMRFLYETLGMPMWFNRTGDIMTSFHIEDDDMDAIAMFACMDQEAGREKVLAMIREAKQEKKEE